MEFKNPLKGKSRTVQILIVVGIIALLIGIAYGTYTMISNPITGTVEPQPTPTPTPTPEPAILTLTLTPETIYVGESWTLTATVSDGTAGIAVTFKEDGAPIDARITNSQGIATLTLTPTLGSHTYTAEAQHP